VPPFHKNVRQSPDCYGVVINLILSAICLMALLLVPALSISRTIAQGSTSTPVITVAAVPPASTVTPGATDGISPELIVLLILSALALLTLPLGYLLFSRSGRTVRSILLVSTDLETHKVFTAAAKRSGYQTIQVYRYEDALDRLRQNTTLRMIAIDDSVPQYEVGLLVSTLQRMPVGLRPLILIRDNSELGQTAFSHQADVLLARPLTEQAVEGAIRRVEAHVDVNL
jgi:CheY-like chemotaxis protein